MTTPSTSGYDAVLLLSFGGPDGPDDVMPFLENVTRGRGVPRERLESVAEHYMHFGGVSPINRLNLDIIDRLRAALGENDIDLPVFFGNRNWHPMVEDTVVEMFDAGHRRVLVFPTSAWGGYSGCAQYHEDIARGLSALTDRRPAAAADPMTLRKLPHYWDRPEMIAAGADALTAARAQLPQDVADSARVVFTAHSVPTAADEVAGPPEQGGHLYSRQVAAASAAVAQAAGITGHDVVWQSRSGPPQVPWLEPDIVDHLEAIHTDGVPAAVVSPIGFVSDHLEVVWDLDTEADEKAGELGMPMARAATVGTDPRYVAMIVELIRDQLAGATTQSSGLGCTDNGERCAPGCCPVVRPRRPS
ncbi:ferrochelatase [Williamsia deligens]|uniref:Coproporphyrin III ferrochelatase n=1 Tax=Williamsia deligens TaxID=321325 RepID=A0ABW3GDG0_9NOCA|nr:ferrochelatase [Williamsia deligens]MCP2195264.1 ferrochelatase [Williamsia deligens]